MPDEASERGPGRRVGRDRVLEAAIGLLEDADLSDLLSFLGTRAVADAADVRPATVHHHFGNPGGTKPNARLAAAVLARCLGGSIVREAIPDLAAAGEAEVLEAGDISSLAANAADNLRLRFEDRTQAVATFLAAAAARNDPVSSEALREEYETTVREYAAVFDVVTRVLGRRYDAEHGWDGTMMALFGTALSDGLALRHQFDPDSIDLEVYGELCLRLFEAVTVRDDEGELVTDAVTERLLSRVSSLDLPEDSGLDQAKRSRIIGAVRDLYDDGGAAAITTTSVARTAGVSRGTVLANFGDRNGLAAAVWARCLPDLELRLETDRERGMPLARLLERHFLRLVDRCLDDRELSALVLDGILGHTIRHGAPTYDDPTDPRSSVPLAEMLVPVLADSADQLRPELGASPDSLKDLASTVTNMIMVWSMARPDEPASETVHRVMDLVLEGMLRPPP